MKKAVSISILLCFFITGQIGACPVYAYEFVLPAPGIRVSRSPQFNPPSLKGIKVYPNNPFRFDFVLDQGDGVIASETKQSQEQAVALKIEATRLIKYFLASLTIPEKDLWVNLSPYEKDRIVPESFGQTEMGRDLLAQDYMLKQITASLIYPEDEVGKKFWKRVYEEAQKKYGTTQVPVNTFNKVWIVPEKAVVYENASAEGGSASGGKATVAYVVESKLKVMLEQDYLALEKSSINSLPPVGREREGGDVNAIGSQIVREIVIPELTKEVNEGKNFAQLRQIYQSLILATWYKKKIKNSILSQVYADKNKVAGINIDDPKEKQKIYEQYLQAFKKGAYNYIKEETDPATQGIVLKKYFSGGADLAMGATNLKPGVLSTTHNDLALRVDENKGDVIVTTRVDSVMFADKPFAKVHDRAMTQVEKDFNKVIQAIEQFNKKSLHDPQMRILRDALDDTININMQGNSNYLIEKARFQRLLGRLNAFERTLLLAREKAILEHDGYRNLIEITKLQAETDVRNARQTFLEADKLWGSSTRGSNNSFLAERIDLFFQLGMEEAGTLLAQEKKDRGESNFGLFARIEFKYGLKTAEETFSKAKEKLFGLMTRDSHSSDVLDKIIELAETAVEYHLVSAEEIITRIKGWIFYFDQLGNNSYRESLTRVAYLDFLLGHEQGEINRAFQASSNVGFGGYAVLSMGQLLAKMGRFEEAIKMAFTAQLNISLIGEIARMQAEKGLFEQALTTASLITIQGDEAAQQVYAQTLLDIFNVGLKKFAESHLEIPFLSIERIFNPIVEPIRYEETTRILLGEEQISTEESHNYNTYLFTYAPRFVRHLRRLGIIAVVASEVVEKDVNYISESHYRRNLVAVYVVVPKANESVVKKYIEKEGWSLPEEKQRELLNSLIKQEADRSFQEKLKTEPRFVGVYYFLIKKYPNLRADQLVKVYDQHKDQLKNKIGLEESLFGVGGFTRINLDYDETLKYQAKFHGNSYTEREDRAQRSCAEPAGERPVKVSTGTPCS